MWQPKRVSRNPLITKFFLTQPKYEVAGFGTQYLMALKGALDRVPNLSHLPHDKKLMKNLILENN